MALRSTLFLTTLFGFLNLYSQGFSGESSFIKIGSASRSAALGRTNLSNFQNVDDILLNPSLLSEQKKQFGLSYSHNSAYKGIVSVDALVFGVNLDSSDVSIGFGLYQFSNSNVFNTQNLQNVNGDFDFSQLNVLSNKDYGMNFIVSKKVNDKLNYGLNTSFETHNLSNLSNSNALGIDFGLLYKKDSMSSIGVQVSNVFGKYYFWNQNVNGLKETYFNTNNFIRYRSIAVQLPSMNIGYTKILSSNEWFSQKALAKLYIGTGENPYQLMNSKIINLDFGLGYEAIVQDKYFVRFSCSDFQKSSWIENKTSVQVSAGGGIKVARFSFDYAISNLNQMNIIAKKHIISLNYNFEKTNKNSSTFEPTRF